MSYIWTYRTLWFITFIRGKVGFLILYENYEKYVGICHMFHNFHIACTDRILGVAVDAVFIRYIYFHLLSLFASTGSFRLFSYIFIFFHLHIVVIFYIILHFTLLQVVFIFYIILHCFLQVVLPIVFIDIMFSHSICENWTMELTKQENNNLHSKY